MHVRPTAGGPEHPVRPVFAFPIAGVPVVARMPLTAHVLPPAMFRPVGSGTPVAKLRVLGLPATQLVSSATGAPLAAAVT